jgi:hypothetical protein
MGRNPLLGQIWGRRTGHRKTTRQVQTGVLTAWRALFCRNNRCRGIHRSIKKKIGLLRAPQSDFRANRAQHAKVISQQAKPQGTAKRNWMAGRPMDHGLRLESDRLTFGIAPDVNIAVWRSAICHFPV